MGLLNKFRTKNKKREIEQEVIENLKALFNTKQNYGAWQKGLGLKSYANVNSSLGAIKEVIADIEKNITLYEKRIKLLNVQWVEGNRPLSLRFQIECLIGKKFHAFYVGFNHCPESVCFEEEIHEHE